MSNEEFLKQLGQSIMRERKKAGITQFDLCSKINFEKSNLSLIENGHRNLTMTTLKRIADGIGCPAMELFKFTDTNDESQDTNLDLPKTE